MNEVSISRVITAEKPDLGDLRVLADAEGYNFVERAEMEWSSGANRFDGQGEGFFLANSQDTIVGVCGLNRDPYLRDATVGRLRHLYVAPHVRGEGVGRELVSSCLDLAQMRFDRVRLRSFESEASRLYERLGFEPVTEPDATHSLDLAWWRSTA